MLTRSWRQFIALESSGGILLFLTLIVALMIANSPWSDFYMRWTEISIQIRIGDLNLMKSAKLWINEGLMALFFLLLTLEIKREVLVGELSNPAQLLLPVSGAIGGIVVPVFLYWLVTKGHAAAKPGWPITMTTDIAFVMGVISCLGRRVPTSLKVFLVALSIIDDILAVLLIALVYTSKLSTTMLLWVGVATLLLFILNWRGVNRIAAYSLVGVVIWVLTVKSGVHATLAGVVVGLAIPLRARTAEALNGSPLHQLEHSLHPWVAFLVLPLFVFVNGGIPWPTGDLHQLWQQPVSLGIITGLFAGKALGVFLFAGLVIIAGIAKMPAKANWPQFLGISTLTGIGFTMSLFFTSLAFQDPIQATLARQAVLIASFIAGIIGSALFFMSKHTK